MELLKKLCLPIFGILLCVFVFAKANTGRFIGVYLNTLFPCVQEPMNSSPCFGIYDIAAMILATIFGIAFLGISISIAVTFSKNKS
jgi:hypothetical protein